MIKSYDNMKRTIDMYIKGEEDLRKRAKYIVYVLDWNVNDLPKCPTDIVKIFYVETIDEAFLDTAFSYGYFGYPIYISDINVYDPDAFYMQDVLSAFTVKHFEKAKDEYEKEKKKSLEEQLKVKEGTVKLEERNKQDEKENKKQKIALLILS